MFTLAVVPVWAISMAVFLSLWPWQPALVHVAVLGLIGTILAELCLHNFRKIPFTCSYLPGRSYAYMAFLSFLGIMFLIARGAQIEESALRNLGGSAAMLALFAIAAICARWRAVAAAKSSEESVQFEEEPVPAILALGLYRDGVLPNR